MPSLIQQYERFLHKAVDMSLGEVITGLASIGQKIEADPSIGMNETQRLSSFVFALRNSESPTADSIDPIFKDIVESLIEKGELKSSIRKAYKRD